MNDRWLAWVRIGFALLTLGAIVFQASNLIGEGIFNPTRFFLFFTILSNLLAAGSSWRVVAVSWPALRQSPICGGAWRSWP